MTSGASAYLIDTNILIYAYDAADPAKRWRAIEVLEAVQPEGALSVQILGEFYTNVIRKPAQPLSREEAHHAAVRFCRSWTVLDLTRRIHLDALRAVSDHKVSYWDALIWATARDNSVPNILTEDQQHGRLIEDVRYFNPFAAEFDLSLLS